MVRDKEFYKTIVRISLPAALQSLIAMLVVQADDIMISRYGEAALGLASGDTSGNIFLNAVSQTNSLTTFYMAIIMGLTSGASVLISQYWGKKDTARIKQVFSIVITICAALSVLAVAAVQLFPEALLHITIDWKKTETIQIALQYFTIVCFSYIPYAITTSLVGMLRSVEVVKVTLYIAIASLFTNVFFNYVLIFGKFGAPELGVKGAAIATIIARSVELVVVCIYAFRVQTRLDLRPKDLLKSERWLWRDYARFGLPVALGDTQWALVTMVKAMIIGRMADVFISANAITTHMMNLGMVFTSALAGGACVVIGKTVGAGDYKRTREYSNTIQVMFLCIGVFMSLLVIAIRMPFVRMYTDNPEVVSLAGTLIWIGALTLIGTTYHASCFVGINRGAGDSKFVMIVDLICGWLVVLPLTALAAFVFKWPLEIIFLCTRIDQCFKWIIAFIRLRGDNWIKNVTRESPAAERA